MTLAIFLSGCLFVLAWQSVFSERNGWRYAHAVLAVLALGYAVSW